MSDYQRDVALQGVHELAADGDEAGLRKLVRACLRELDEEREAVAHAADLERGEDRCLPRHAESLEGLLPETEGEA